jgi:streptomycin 6-kinase
VANRANIAIPQRLDAIRKYDGGAAWLDTLPQIVRECAERWDLTLHDPFDDGNVSRTAPVTRADGIDAVLKVQFPGHESEHEADALALWDGDGAVRLLAHDRERSALLLERCVPGTPLSRIGDANAALDVLIALLPRLWKPAAAPFTSLSDEAAWWASYLPQQYEDAGRPFERSLLDAALAAIRDLAPTQGEQVLLHQDLHGDNVLTAQREPWLVIDPKPLAGEREFAVAPIVRSFELGHSRAQVVRRLDRLCDELSLDPRRAGLWTVAQTIAWSLGSEYHATHIETAAWVLGAVG